MKRREIIIPILLALLILGIAYSEKTMLAPEDDFFIYYLDSDGNNPRIPGCVDKFDDTSCKITKKIDTFPDKCLNEKEIEEQIVKDRFNNIVSQYSCNKKKEATIHNCDEVCKKLPAFSGGNCVTKPKVCEKPAKPANIFDLRDPYPKPPELISAAYCNCIEKNRQPNQ
jgi:hypothetical protein